MQIYTIGLKDRRGPRESVGGTNSLIFLEIQSEVHPAEEKSVVTVCASQQARQG